MNEIIELENTNKILTNEIAQLYSKLEKNKKKIEGNLEEIEKNNELIKLLKSNI